MVILRVNIFIITNFNTYRYVDIFHLLLSLFVSSAVYVFAMDSQNITLLVKRIKW